MTVSDGHQAALETKIYVYETVTSFVYFINEVRNYLSQKPVLAQRKTDVRS